MSGYIDTQPIDQHMLTDAQIWAIEYARRHEDAKFFIALATFENGEDYDGHRQDSEPRGFQTVEEYNAALKHWWSQQKEGGTWPAGSPGWYLQGVDVYDYSGRILGVDGGWASQEQK